MDVFIKDMRAKILSDGSNSEGLMAAHRKMGGSNLGEEHGEGDAGIESSFLSIFMNILTDKIASSP